MSLKDEIQAVQNQLAHAIALRDIDRAAALYTTDGSLMPDAMPTCDSHEALLGFFGGVCDSGIVAARRYELFAAHPSGDRMRVDDGRYLCVWRKVDDNWRIHRDIFNRSEPRQ
jgi:ketosteroid isomerase-like protein